MDRIARAAEKHIHSHPEDGPAEMEVEPSVYHAVAEAAVRLAETIDAAAIIAFTASGNTAVRLAREQPTRPLIGAMPRYSGRAQAHPVMGGGQYQGNLNMKRR